MNADRTVLVLNDGAGTLTVKTDVGILTLHGALAGRHKPTLLIYRNQLRGASPRGIIPRFDDHAAINGPTG